MKVHIINLEPEDDHASTRDKLSWARASKVVLVWPRRGRPLDRRLDLTVVQRHSNRLGLDLGLVTFEPEVIAHAEQLGIPVFDSLEKLPPGAWTEPHVTTIPHRERRPLSELREARDADNGALIELGERGRLIVVGISVMAMIALAITILPRAEIIVDPTGIPMKENLEIWIDPLSASTSNKVLGQTVSAQISGTRRIETSGRVRLPQSAASGEVEFINLTDDDLVIPAGTGLRAGEVRFLTTEEAELEAGEGSSVILPIEAAEPGVSGNVPAGAIDSIEGPLGFLVTASNLEPTRGGGDQVAGAVSAGDMENLRQALEAELLEPAERALVEQLDRGFVLVPGSLRVTEVLDEHYDIGLGEAAESLGLSLTLNIEGLGYSVPLVRDAAEQKILATLPLSRMLIPGSLSLEAVDASADWPSMEVIFEVEGSLAKTVDRDLLRQLVLGNPKEQAAARLERILGLDEAPQIQTSPGWMPWMPFLGMRIDFKWVWESA